ncbi:DUF3429 domain-containing protein [Methylophaga sp.]|uniref:DUF3429 domain-containing protein n=1 Tax=Methylophaga sp. TaxID=2024840 RepID=UPI001400D890|nr:DUF3429 domain-containing protein [Methylophaga sp.]MTI64168.1 DUF3429 domain-containing protein [Methylophaga sp.]
MRPQHRYLGYAGLIPFIVLALGSLLNSRHAEIFLIDYAALIFSFLGGMLWTLSIRQKLPAHVALVAVSAMLWAWLWLLTPAYNWLWLAALSFVALWLYEWSLLRRFIAHDFLILRGQLSLVAALSLVLANF